MTLDQAKQVFWDMVIKQDSGCWEWTGRIKPRGYGAISIDGKEYLAHRAAWIITNGFIPKGFYVCHHCDNRKCINPDHLFIGTQRDNVQDCISKGRFDYTLNNLRTITRSRRKLTQQQADTIRQEYQDIKDSKSATRMLADKYGVSTVNIWGIIANQSYLRE